MNYYPSLYTTPIVSKTEPDQPVRPVQPGTGSQSGPIKTSKIGQKPELNQKLKKKNNFIFGSVFKIMTTPLLSFFFFTSLKIPFQNCVEETTQSKLEKNNTQRVE